MKESIEVINVTKQYSKFKLDQVSMHIPSGSIVGLVGENGAGKTTLIKLILNLIKKDQGTIKLFEKDHILSEKEIKQEIGVVLEDSFFPEILKVKDIDSVLSKLYQHWDSELFFRYIKDFQLPTNQLIKNLSKGMKMKLQIISALAHHPKLLILDEPTSGLDPVVRNEILDIFQEFIQDETHSILLSTHITSDLEHIADYITFIHEGKIILAESRDELMDNYGVIKCKKEDFDKIDTKDIIKYRKNRYDYEILINNKKEAKKKYKEMIIDPITIETMMVLLIKGEN